MKATQPRPGTFTLTMTTHELSVLVAGARMALKLMEAEKTSSNEQAQRVLGDALADLDSAVARTRGTSQS
jgi:hypothetical protein